MEETPFESITPRYPELAGRTALITGSGHGIGKAIAVRFAREGARVVITGRTESAVSETTAQIAAKGGEAVGIPADLTRPDDVARLFDTAGERYGTIDVLVNNAALLKRLAFFEVDRELFDASFATNVSGAFDCSRRAAEGMRDSGGGSIINISSVGGAAAHWRSLPYDSTKGALDLMTKGMAIELIDWGIRVNSVAPGATYNRAVSPPPEDFRTEWNDRIPIRRIACGLEIAAVVAFLASDEASYIVGQVIYVDGGLTTQLGPRTAPV